MSFTDRIAKIDIAAEQGLLSSGVRDDRGYCSAPVHASAPIDLNKRCSAMGE